MNPSDLIYGTGKYERKPMDFYPTPADVTHALIDHLEKHLMIGKGQWIWEPACGDGAMAEVFIERGYHVFCSDIRDTGYKDQRSIRDFIADVMWDVNTEWIITNPPFNVSEAFIRRCLIDRLNRPFALLLKSQYWHSMKRNTLFYERKPMFVCPLSWRPAFGGKGKSSLMDFVWTIWGRESGDARYIPLKRKGGNNG